MSHKSLFPHNNIQFRLERAKYEFQNARSQKKEHSQIEKLRVHYAKCCLSWVFFHGGGEEYLSEVMTLLRKPNIDNSIETTSLLALGHIGRGNPSAAENQLLKIQPQAQESALFHFALAFTYQELHQDKKEMLLTMQRACELEPGAWEPHFYLAKGYLKKGERQGEVAFIHRAMYHLINAMELDPNAKSNPELIKDMGEACLYTGRYKEADFFFHKIMRISYFQPEIDQLLGRVSFYLNKYNNAKNYLRNYLDVYPDDSRVIAQMALCLYELNNKEEALEYARKAKLLDGKNLLARRIQSQILVEMELYEDAARILSQTMQEFPEEINFFREFIQLCVYQSEEGGMWLENLLYQNLNAYEALSPFDTTSQKLYQNRIACILNLFEELGASWIYSVLRGRNYTQDEHLRFSLWCTTCNMVSRYIFEDVENKLSDHKQYFSPSLGQDISIVHSYFQPEEILQSLDISAEDIKRAATNRYPAASDVHEHRQRIQKENKQARMYQGLLCLALAIHPASPSQDRIKEFLQEWSKNEADKDMSLLANISLCILSANTKMSKQEKETPTKAIKAHEIIKKELKTDEQKERFENFVSSLKESTNFVSLQLDYQSTRSCACCGKKPSIEESRFLLISNDTYICSECCYKIQSQPKQFEVDFGICDFSYKTPMNDVRIYACDKKDGSGKLEICSDCLLIVSNEKFSRDVDSYFYEWSITS